MLRVRFFAALRENLQCGDWECPADCADVAALLERLEAHWGEKAAGLRAADTLVAVNQELVHSAAHPLQDGDEVAFFPPASGG